MAPRPYSRVGARVRGEQLFCGGARERRERVGAEQVGGDPADLARKVNRRVAPGTVSVPRQVKSAVRIPVRTPRENEQLFQIVRELMQARFPRSRRVVG